MNKVIVLAGISGSGKSTYAQTLRNADLNAIVVSSDETRKLLYGDESEQGDPKEVFRVVDHTIQSSLRHLMTVIVDATNLAPWQRESYVKAAQSYGVPVELHYVMATLDEAQERQYGRDRQVPEHVVARMAEQQAKDLNRPAHEFMAEGFNAVRFIV